MKEDNQYIEEVKFIKNNFYIRTCYKYCGINDDICECNRLRINHEIKERDQNKWSYENNTHLDECTYYGTINFPVCDNLCSNHKFIRFNIIDTTSTNNISLPSTVEAAYTLTNTYWQIPKPKLIISVIGGFKKMDISSKQKKNFKQGLIDIMKRDKTMIIAGGFNVGVHKLVSETVREFRIYYENEETQVYLIGICTWGVVWKNSLLAPSNDGNTGGKILYENKISNEKGKVTLDHNYDGFLFCDDGTEKMYDKEVDFRALFEKYVERECDSFAVQILCEGGYRAVYSAYKTLKNKTSIVVLKGSGRAADLISDVMGLKQFNYENNIMQLLHEYKTKLCVQEKDIPSLFSNLKDMYENYSKQVIIYDMLDPKMKFEKMIVKAIISGQTKNSVEDTLKLTIHFDCIDIAEVEVFSHSDYSKIDGNFIKKHFIEVLKKDQFEFVISFLENGIDISDVLTEETLVELYRESLNIKKCPYADMLNDLISKKDKRSYELHFIGKIIPILSGNILKNYYSKQNCTKSDTKHYSIKDLFLWALFSGRIELAKIFWRFGKDHISSALIGATILKNMAFLILKRGDSELEKNLSDASINFEKLAFNILTKAYSKNRSKTVSILIRQIKMWNKMTCLQIALNSNLLEFLSHSACRSYTTQVWLGGISPFVSLWKILICIPFSLCFIHLLIIPSFSKKVVIKRTKGFSDSLGSQAADDCIPSIKETFSEENVITCSQAMKMFYSAPIVKFYINFAYYLIFLVIFAYVNLVELKPRKKIKKSADISAEIFVYIYIVTFIIEEVRQINDQSRNDFQSKLKAYFSGSCNQVDVFIIVVFIISTVVRFLLTEELFMICRCMFSVCYCMFCLRTMQFYFAYEFVGPKVIMIYDMIKDIVFFISIFALFIVSFGTLSLSMRSPNSEMNIYLIKDIFYMPYFQTYGELMLDKLFEEGVCNTTKCQLQQTTVVVGFMVYLLFTNILLVNLLIAMFGYTFNKIQDQSEKFWLFIRLQLVEEFYKKPILSPPFNILYYFFEVFFFLIKFCKCRKKKRTLSNYDDDIDMGTFSNNFKEVMLFEVNDGKKNRKSKISNNDDYSLWKVLSRGESIRITGFEQICMEAMMEYMQLNIENFVTEAEVKTDESEKKTEKIQLHSEKIEAQDISNNLFLINCDKRLEKIENSIEKLIYKKNNNF